MQIEEIASGSEEFFIRFTAYRSVKYIFFLNLR